MKDQIILEEFGERHGPYALGVCAGPFIFTNQIGTNADGTVVSGGIKAETRRIMEKAKAVLESVGSDMNHVAKVTIYITDIALIPEMNEVYQEYFTDGYPVRCCTKCASLAGSYHVEMEFTAIKK
nr:RidA family protein [uncultured Mediterraneibacter sp.]